MEVYKLQTDSQLLAGSQGGRTDPWEQEGGADPSSQGGSTKLWELGRSTDPWEQE